MELILLAIKRELKALSFLQGAETQLKTVAMLFNHGDPWLTQIPH